MENIIQEKEKSSRVNWMNNKYFLFDSRRLQPAGVDYKRNLKVAATFKFRIFGQHNTNAEKRSRSRQRRTGLNQQDRQEQRKGNSENQIYCADIVCTSLHLDRS